MLATRNHLLQLQISSIQKLFIDFTEKKSDLIYNKLQDIHSTLAKTVEWECPLELQVGINKAERDWRQYRILMSLAKDNIPRAQNLIETLLSDVAINEYNKDNFNELKYYELCLTGQYLEIETIQEKRELGKIYISKQHGCLMLGLDGGIYRWALSNEQHAMLQEFPAPLENPVFKQSLLTSAARQSYSHLRFELKLQIVEKLLEKKKLDSACEEMKKIIADAILQKHTLDLRKRPLFRNEAFWEKVPIQNIHLYLDFGQAQALGEQRVYYNEALFKAIENGDLQQVEYGIQYFYWSAYLRNQQGCSSVIFACLHGHNAIAQYLATVGGEISLIHSSQKGEIDPLDELVQKYKQDKGCYRPIIFWLIHQGLSLKLKHALLLEDAELFKMNLEQLENSEAKQEFLFTAIQEGLESVIKLLLIHQKEYIASFPMVKMAPKKSLFSIFDEEEIVIPQKPTLLQIACQSGHLSIVHLFLNEPNIAGAHINKQFALKYLAQLFLQNYPAPSANPRKFQALYEKWKQIAAELCRHGAQHDVHTWVLFSTHLKNSRQYIHKDTLDKPCDAKKNTPLHLAVKTWNIELVRFLIGNKAALELVNADKETPLYLACQQGADEIVQCLLEANVSPDGPRRELTESEKAHIMALTSTFPEMDALLNKRPLCLQKEPPLHCAIQHQQIDVVKILCLYKADSEEKYQGKTALDLAIEVQNKEIIFILLRYKAEYVLNTHSEVSPHAHKAYQIEMMKLFITTYVKQFILQGNRFQRQALLEEFCNEIIQWAGDFKKGLDARGSEKTASMPNTISSSLSLSSSISSSTPVSSSSASLLATPLAMFPPVENKLDVYLSEYLQKKKENTQDDPGSNHADYRLEELEYEYHTDAPPEAVEPFYVIPSTPEEIEREEKTQREDSPRRLGRR